MSLRDCAFLLSSNPDHQTEVFNQYDFITEQLGNNPVTFSQLVENIDEEFEGNVDAPTEDDIINGLIDLEKRYIVQVIGL